MVKQYSRKAQKDEKFEFRCKNIIQINKINFLKNSN